MAEVESADPPLGGGNPDLRCRVLVELHLRFIWRALRRLGIPNTELPDASQQVFTIAARKIAAIREGSERAFLYQTAVRVASDLRRSLRRRREDGDETLDDHADEGDGPDELADRARARAMLDAALGRMPMDLRSVFVLFELEEITMAEIASLLQLPMGTVASRLRRARELFQVEVRRVRAKGGGP
jgi:RNA polymerase sigma-70 factor, ECF subfamily